MYQALQAISLRLPNRYCLVLHDYGHVELSGPSYIPVWTNLGAARAALPDQDRPVKSHDARAVSTSPIWIRSKPCCGPTPPDIPRSRSVS
jgi:hypothetical protein